MKTTNFLATVALSFLAFNADAAEIETNTARMQAMDKITGRVSVINVPVNGKVNFGSLSIVARACKTRPAEETPENFAFIDIADKTPEGKEINIFKGWMLSSSPATNALENPIYDVWLLQCLNTKPDDASLLSEKELAERDNLPMSQRNDLSATASAKLKSAEPQPRQTDASAEKAMAEMEYPPEEETHAPENLVDTNGEDSEFSVDEEDDDTSAEIQDELNKIKDDSPNSEPSAEQQAE